MGFFDKIKNGLARTKQSMTVSMNNLFSSFTGENEEFFDDLEETLILADAGVETAENAVEKLRGVVHARGLRGGAEVQGAFVEIMADMLYGVTMQEKGVTTVLNVDLDEAERTIAMEQQR